MTRKHSKCGFIADHFQKELSEWLEIAPAQKSTHIWSGETMISYLHFLAGEIRQRRRHLGLSLKDACLVICDQASQHTAASFKRMRDEWCVQHNVALWLDVLSFIYAHSRLRIYIYNIHSHVMSFHIQGHFVRRQRPLGLHHTRRLWCGGPTK